MILANVEAILTEIERLDAESKGQFRQASDKEAFDLVCKIERKMQQRLGVKKAKA